MDRVPPEIHLLDSLELIASVANLSLIEEGCDEELVVGITSKPLSSMDDLHLDTGDLRRGVEDDAIEVLHVEARDVGDVVGDDPEMVRGLPIELPLVRIEGRDSQSERLEDTSDVGIDVGVLVVYEDLDASRTTPLDEGVDEPSETGLLVELLEPQSLRRA